VSRFEEDERFQNIEEKERNERYKLDIEYNDLIINNDNQFKKKLHLLLSNNSDWLESKLCDKYLRIQKDFRAVYNLDQLTWFIQ
jgi:hypothetical protein